MSEDQVTRNENTSIPEYAATRGARLERVLARASDAPLRGGTGSNSSRTVPRLTTIGSWRSPGPSGGSTSTTTSSRTTPRAIGSRRPSLRNPPRVCVSASSTTGSVRWMYRENSGENYAMRVLRSGRSIHRRLGRRSEWSGVTTGS